MLLALRGTARRVTSGDFTPSHQKALRAWADDHLMFVPGFTDSSRTLAEKCWSRSMAALPSVPTRCRNVDAVTPGDVSDVGSVAEFERSMIRERVMAA